MIRIEIEQNSPEWLEFRKDKIGGSDAPIIMESSPYKTPYQHWVERVSDKKQVSNAAMEYGHEMEPIARAAYEELTGLLMLPCVGIHSKHPWMMVSLDGMCIEGERKVEIKCSNKEDHKMVCEGIVPQKWYPQLQHQMEVSESQSIDLFSFNGGFGIAIRVERNHKYINNLIEKEFAFWECLQKFSAPNLTEKDYRTKESSEWHQAATEWVELNLQLKEMEKKEKELREKIISMSDNSNAIGGGIKVSRIICKGHVDYTSIPHLQGVNLEDYRKEPTERWKISSLKS